MNPRNADHRDLKLAPDGARTIGVRANIHLGVKPSFARMANANCLSRGPAREKK